MLLLADVSWLGFSSCRRCSRSASASFSSPCSVARSSPLLFQFLFLLLQLSGFRCKFLSGFSISRLCLLLLLLLPLLFCSFDLRPFSCFSFPFFFRSFSFVSLSSFVVISLSSLALLFDHVPFVVLLLLLVLSLFFASVDGDRSRFLDAIVSSCSSSAVLVDGVTDSIGTSIVCMTDRSEWFDIEMLDTMSVLVGVFE